MKISVDEALESRLSKAQIWRFICRDAKKLGLEWLINEDSCAADLKEDQEQAEDDKKS